MQINAGRKCVNLSPESATRKRIERKFYVGVLAKLISVRARARDTRLETRFSAHE